MTEPLPVPASPPEPASLARTIAALLAMELRLTARRYENLLVMFGLPPILLVFLAAVPIRGGAGGSTEGALVTLLGPVVAIAMAASGFVNLGIATAYERGYGVLKRLGGSPAPVGAVILAKVAAVGVVALGQLALLGVVAVGVGWRPEPTASLPVLGAGLLLGLLAFAGLGLLFGGTLRAEAALAVVNGTFLVFLLLGGILVPVENLPGVLRDLAELMPVTALARIIAAGLGATDGAGAAAVGRAGGDLAALAVWAAITAVAARRTFRWE
ncbi:MAG TPA: ABC transporter permease [Candidatus Binatia bacterium]|nr:ABC transporter permease [Candidatus Binatia bacterium]